MFFFRNLVQTIMIRHHQQIVLNIDLHHLEKNVDESHQVPHHLDEMLNDIRYIIDFFQSRVYIICTLSF